MPTAPRKVFMFVTRMRPPTAVPRMRAGMMRTMYAAIGAATMPPRRSAPTTVHGISANLRAKRKPMLALKATRNSLVSTVPMILRGSMRPEESSVGVEEPGDQTQRSQEACRDGPYLDGTLVPPKGEAGEHEHAEPEQEDGDDRLGRLGGDEGAQHHSAKECPNRTRYRERPDFGPVHVPETPVRSARCRRRSYLGDVHARRSKGRRNANSEQQTLRSHPVCHAERPIDQLRDQAHNRQQQEISHSPTTSPFSLLFISSVELVYHRAHGGPIVKRFGTLRLAPPHASMALRALSACQHACFAGLSAF